MLPPNSDLLNECYAERARKQASRSISCGIQALVAIILDAILFTVFNIHSYGLNILFLLFCAIAILAFILIILSMIFAVSAKYDKHKLRKEVILKTNENWAFIPALVVLAAICIVLCINFLAFLDYRKERLTARNLRVNAAILDIYFIENSHYPFPGFSGKAEELLSKLDKYKENFKVTDGWGRKMFYACTQSGEYYYMIAPCKDGELDDQSKHILDCVSKGQNEIANLRGGPRGRDNRYINPNYYVLNDIVLNNGIWAVGPSYSGSYNIFSKNTDLYAVAEEKER